MTQIWIIVNAKTIADTLNGWQYNLQIQCVLFFNLLEKLNMNKLVTPIQNINSNSNDVSDVSLNTADQSILTIPTFKSGFDFFQADGLKFSSEELGINSTLDELIDDRLSWESNELLKSNVKLYEILTRCYSVFKSMTGTKPPAVIARNAFKKVVKARGYNFSESTHLMVQVIRVVFGSESRRTNRYANALRIASEQNIPVNDLKDFFILKGGVEAVCRLKSNQGMSRFEIGKSVLNSFYLTTISDKLLTEDFEIDEYEDAVVFLATYDEVYDSFDILRVIQKKSVVKACFESLASDVSPKELAIRKEYLAEIEAQITANSLNKGV